MRTSLVLRTFFAFILAAVPNAVRAQDVSEPWSPLSSDPPVNFANHDVVGVEAPEDIGLANYDVGIDSYLSGDDYDYDYDCAGGDCDHLQKLVSRSYLGDWLRPTGIRASGWLDQGFTWNPDNPSDRFNGPQGFNDRSNEYQLNQLNLTVERPVNANGRSWDIGGRFDLLYGSDYFFLTAIGLETDGGGTTPGTQKWVNQKGPRAGGTAPLMGLALPQLFAEVALPLADGVSVKIGHFYSNFGYESARAPDNFFYSHSYVFLYGQPLTHTGFLATMKYTDNFVFSAGMTRGWNNWEDTNNNLGFLGKAKWTSDDERTSLGFSIHTSAEDPRGVQTRTVYSLVLKHQFTDALTYVIQQNYGTEKNGRFKISNQKGRANWFGINQYLLYQINEKLGAGLRVEWFDDPDNARILQIPSDGLGISRGGNYTALSVGLNYKPHRCLTIRPELRWDWSDVEVGSPFFQRGQFDTKTDKNQFTFATDIILRF